MGKFRRVYLKRWLLICKLSNEKNTWKKQHEDRREGKHQGGGYSIPVGRNSKIKGHKVEKLFRELQELQHIKQNVASTEKEDKC